MHKIEVILFQIRELLWSAPLLFSIIALGLYLTFRLKGIQFKYLFYSLKLLIVPKKSEKDNVGELSPFQSIMTALAGAIGTGSIAGVAIAISIGGYGSIFWLWITSLFGMIISFSENTLAIKYRTHDKDGQIVGGPMYTLQNGVNSKKLGQLFAFLGASAAFGIGATVQSNSVATALNFMYGVPLALTGITFSLLAILVIFGGVKSIGKVASLLVPFMSILYIISSLIILIVFYKNLIPALNKIVVNAFSLQAQIGGFAGASILTAVQMGAARSIFSSEAGLGSSPIAAINARTSHPAEYGMLSMAAVFISSIIICSMTALVIIVTDSLGEVDNHGLLMSGAQLTLSAFGKGYHFTKNIVLVCLIFFGFTTLLTWAYYGEKCIEYLLKKNAILYYRLIYIILIFLGSLINVHLIWAYADIANALMIIPNLFGVAYLSNIIIKEKNDYVKNHIK